MPNKNEFKVEVITFISEYHCLEKKEKERRETDGKRERDKVHNASAIHSPTETNPQNNQ